MEKIFEDSCKLVDDGGFSDRVIQKIVETASVPSRQIYRAPTLIATFAGMVVIIVLTFTVGLDKMSDRYDELASKMAYHTYPVDDIDMGIEIDVE